ncbi:MAG: hypothetical protein AB7N76_06220 [Planctomycetota bacterium]
MRRRLVLPLLLLVTPLLLARAGAQDRAQDGAQAPSASDPDAPSVSVHAGYGPGVFPRGRTCPVAVDLSLGGGALPFRGSLQLEVLDPELTGRPSLHDWLPVELGPGASKRYLLRLRGDDAKGARLVLRDEAGREAWASELRYGEALAMLPAGLPLFGTLAPADGGKPRLHWPAALVASLSPGILLGERAAVLERAPAVPIARRLLDAEGALSGVDALIVAEPPGLEAHQAQALTAWVEEGGLLLLGAGTRGIEWSNDALAPLLPMEVLAQAQRLGALRALGSERAVGLLRGKLRAGARVLQRGPDDDPLLVTWRRGRGQVSLVTFGLDVPELGEDEARRRLIASALPLPEPRLRETEPWDALEEAGLALTTNALAARTSSAWTGWLVLLLLLVVGPLDYLVWRRWPGPRVTWGLLLVVTLGFSALAFALGHTGGAPLESDAAWVIDACDAGGAGEARGAQPVVVEGLVALLGQGYRSELLTLPAGLRFEPAGGAAAGERCSRRQGRWALHERAAAVELGLAGPLSLRVRGRARAAFPFVARWTAEGEVELKNVSGRALTFTILGAPRTGEMVLSPGERRVVLFQRDGAAPQGQLTRASLRERARVEESRGGSPSDEESGALARGVDLSARLDWDPFGVAIVAEDRAPPALVSVGERPLPVQGRALYRCFLPPFADEQEGR